jgi:hypothetical protein
MIFLVDIASPSCMFAMPCGCITAIFGLGVFVLILSFFDPAHSSDSSSAFVGWDMAFCFPFLVAGLIALLGNIYVFDRSHDWIRVYRGPIIMKKYILSELEGMTLEFTGDAKGGEVAKAQLVFHTGQIVPINTVWSGSTEVLKEFKKALERFLDAEP